jgi:hypothetical protein
MPEFEDISTKAILLTGVSNKSFSYNWKEFLVLRLFHFSRLGGTWIIDIW